jgi:hypothetical protein
MHQIERSMACGAVFHAIVGKRKHVQVIIPISMSSVMDLAFESTSKGAVESLEEPIARWAVGADEGMLDTESLFPEAHGTVLEVIRIIRDKCQRGTESGDELGEAFANVLCGGLGDSVHDYEACKPADHGANIAIPEGSGGLVIPEGANNIHGDHR